MPQEDDSTSELNHPEEILWVVFPANDDATKVMKPSEQVFNLPTAALTTQAATVLSCGGHAHKFVRRNELYTVAFLDVLVQRIAVVSAVADHSLRSFLKEALLEGGFDEFCFMRRSAGHVHGERKTMAVCDCHDFAAFAALCRADTRAPFFAPLKLASMKESLLDQRKRNPSGAVGIMQVIPKYAAASPINVDDVTTAGGNIQAGVKMLRNIEDRYFNDPNIDQLDKTLLVFASYNAGPTRIAKLREQARAQGLDPNRWFENVELIVAQNIGQETVTYVGNVYKYYVAYKLAQEHGKIAEVKP